MQPVRLALSNDYEVVLRGLAAMLANHSDRVEVVELSGAAQMSEEVDVILFDTFGRMPDEDEKLAEIVAANDAPVVLYSWHTYPEAVGRERGATGYLHKGLSAEELVDAIVAIHERRPSTPRRPDGEAMPAWPGQEHGLSARESEVIAFVAQGMTNDEIARRSYLSVNTVKTYLRTAYRKIGAQRRSQAVAWALQHGFRQIED
ncbi:response regulator transcription factor [Nocardioides sp.]|uniref:helix-turn-helix transcriptional regulator n=1 Tax=Nocardioides sp. TaxID=35761 RepID=UPI0025FBFEBC|nr:response regulator transcription factor [Nocardioides sp.]